MRAVLAVAFAGLLLPALAAPATAHLTNCSGGETVNSTFLAGHHIIPRPGSMAWEVRAEDNGLEGAQATHFTCLDTRINLTVIVRWADTHKATVSGAVCTLVAPVCTF